MRTPLDPLDTRSHGSLGANSCRSIVVDDLAHCGIERVEVLSVGLDGFDTVSLKGGSYAVLFQVFRRMSTAIDQCLIG